MAFRFRLDRVLGVCRQRRRLESQALAVAQAELERLDVALGAAREAQAAAWNAEAQRSEWTGGELQALRSFAAAAQARERRLTTERTEAEALVERRREVVLARRRDERTLEVLRGYARARWEQRAERRRALDLDELALRGRQRRERKA